MSEESSNEEAPARRRRFWVVKFLLCYVLFAFFASAFINDIFLAEFPMRLLCGWFIHAKETLPPLLGNWRAVLLPLGCLVVAGFLAHRLAGWWRKSQGITISWRRGHTLAVMALFLSCCAAGIAMSGIIHQVAWLSGDPLVHDSSRDFYPVRADRQTMDLVRALNVFHDEHLRYPDRLDELPLPKEKLWLKTDSGEVKEPFILLHAGEAELVQDDELLVLSPVAGSGHMFAAGFASGKCTYLPASELERILGSRGKGYHLQPPHADE